MTYSNEQITREGAIPEEVQTLGLQDKIFLKILSGLCSVSEGKQIKN